MTAAALAFPERGFTIVPVIVVSSVREWSVREETPTMRVILGKEKASPTAFVDRGGR